MYMWNKLKAVKSIVLLKYHCKLSGCGVSGRICTAPWIALIRTIYVVLTLKWGLRWYLPSCKACIAGWCLSSRIAIPAVWRIGPVAKVWTKATSPLMLDWASSMKKGHFNRARMRPAVDLKWLSGLVPIQRSTVSFLGGLCFLHLVDPVQQTIWTACSSLWEDVTGISIGLCRMDCALLRWLKSWLWST